MDIHNCSTALFVKNIEISKIFYTNTLQLPVRLDFGKNIILQNGLTLWEINKSHIISTSLGVEKITDGSCNRFELYFETDHLEEVYADLKKNGVQFIHEIHEESWGQQTIRFFDPDNHLIEVGESMKLFVTRIYNQGLSVEQVSEKTHVPAEEVKRLIEG